MTNDIQSMLSSPRYSVPAVIPLRDRISSASAVEAK
jgi:hypothetical protein